MRSVSDAEMLALVVAFGLAAALVGGLLVGLIWWIAA